MKNIKLTWKADGTIDSYTIYRSTESININKLPEPIFKGLVVKEYIDTYNGEANILYYRIASIRKGKKKISEEYIIKLSNFTLPTIICDGASSVVNLRNSVSILDLDSFGIPPKMDVYVNGILEAEDISMYIHTLANDTEGYFGAIKEKYNLYTYSDSSNNLYIVNNGNTPIRFVFVPKQNGEYSNNIILARDFLQLVNEDITAQKDRDTGVISFCLSVNAQE